MSYTPLYTSEALIEGYLQIAITGSTNPSTTETLVWIEEVETEIVRLGLGSHSSGTVYFDVPVQSNITRMGDWKYDVKADRLITEGEGEAYMIPIGNIKGPIISITALAKNDQDVEDAPDWEALTEWNGTVASHYMMLKSNTLGYALYFYDEYPLSGPNRLRMTYTYGHNVASAILQEYTTLKAAAKVLESRNMAADPVGVAMFRGPDMSTFVNVNIEQQLERIDKRCEEIERKSFPKKRTVLVAV